MKRRKKITIKQMDQMDQESDRMASKVMNVLLYEASAIDTEMSYTDRMKLINTFSAYRRTKLQDILFVIQRIKSMSNPQLTAFRGDLKKQGLLEDFKKGSLDLKSVYNLRHLKE